MFLKSAISAVALSVMASGAFAQGFTGGEVGLSYSSFLGDNADNGAFTFSGAVEYDFTRAFGIQFDLSGTSYGEIDVNGTAIGISAATVNLHAIYHINEGSSVGVYYGSESFGASDGAVVGLADYSYIGVELGYETGDYEFEMYYSKPLDDLIDISGSFGLSGAYAITEDISLTADFDRFSSDGATLFAIGGEYDVNDRFSVAGEVGQASGDIESEAFIGLSVGYTFGANRGATFDGRGISLESPGL